MIKIVGSNKTFKMNQKDFVALKEINLKIESCGLYVISGESGSGKTTLLNCIAGIDSFDNTNPSNIIPKGQTSFIFQDYHLVQQLTVEQNAKFALEINGINDEKKTDSLLKELHLADWKDHLPNELSGGQKQRVAIMRALLTDKPVIIADEPTGNLDEENAEEISQILKKISKDKIVIVATHNLLLFEKLADEIFYLKNGIIENHLLLENDRTPKIPNQSSNKEKLKWKHVYMFSLKGYRTHYSKLIMMMLTSLLSFLFALTAINIMFNSVYRIKYNHFKNQELNYIELVGYQGNFQSDRLTSIDDETIDSLISKYSLSEYMLFVDQIEPQILMNDEITDISVSRIYRTDVVPFNSMLNNKQLVDNECAISEDLAKQLIAVTGDQKIDDLIGQDIYINETSLLISNIAFLHPELSGNDSFTIEEKQMLDNYLYSIFVNEYTYRKMSNATQRNIISISLNESTMSMRITDYNNSFFRDLEYGALDLEDDEVVISSDTAALLTTGETSSLIGQPISFEIFRYMYGVQNPVSSDIKTFYIKGIFKNSSEQIPWMFSDYQYEQLSYMYGKNNYHSMALNGFAITSYSPGLLKELDQNQITDYTYGSLSINVTHEYIQSIATILLGFGIILLIISVLIVLSYMNMSILYRKNEIGLLTSLNISMKDISKIFLLEITSILFVISFVTGILELIMLDLFNSILIKQGLISFNYVYYNPLAFIVIIAIPLIFIFIYSIVVMHKLKKNTAVELIRFV
jgi:putative ABC transport system ATP-binding protein